METTEAKNSFAQMDGFAVKVEGETPDLGVSLSRRDGEAPGIVYLDVRVTSATQGRPGPVTLSWEYPIVRTHQCTGSSGAMNLCAFGRPRVNSSATNQAPVWCLYDIAGGNRLTFAVSDAVCPVELGSRVIEETACLTCYITFFRTSTPGFKSYETSVRFDVRPQPYYETLREVAEWWAAMPDYTPAPVPEHARLPMYSTWYSFHQGLSPEAIETQCRLAKDLGMESVIVDDGWQTDDNQRGYAYCGDWEVTLGKFADLRAHVDRVHAMGMKYLLWFSVPFVGVHSKAYARFKDKFLSSGRVSDWYVLDTRFPEVREYLIGVYERCMREFDLDGLKLDFVNCFTTPEESKDILGGGRDYVSVPHATDRFLTDVIARLRKIKPDVMIEFRQPYAGPVMRKYGNIFRVGDEPNNFAGNRTNSMPLRVLSGNTAVHCDMVMWHPQDSVESAAMQLLHSAFTVPQISVKLDALPENHVAMVRRYLAFWLKHRDVLLDGRIMPQQPQHGYPAVISATDEKVAAAVYADGFVSVPAVGGRTLVLINGTLGERAVVAIPDALGRRRIRAWSCTGECVTDETREFGAGLHALRIPPAGTAEVTAQEPKS